MALAYFQAQKPVKPSYTRKVQSSNQWYDVGIVKGISMMVTHYYLSPETTTNEVGEARLLVMYR